MSMPNVSLLLPVSSTFSHLNLYTLLHFYAFTLLGFYTFTFFKSPNQQTRIFFNCPSIDPLLYKYDFPSFIPFTIFKKSTHYHESHSPSQTIRSVTFFTIKKKNSISRVISTNPTITIQTISVSQSNH